MLLSMIMVGQVDVFRHYGYMLSIYSTQVSIFQEDGQIVFDSLLQHLDCAHLEAQIMCPICLCHLAEQACKGSLTDEKLSTLLVLTYLVESHNPWMVPLGPLQPPLQNYLWGPSYYCWPDAASFPTGCQGPHLCHHLSQQSGG